MRSFRAYFKKEFKEAVRNYKYIILAAGFIFWALLDPLMLKLLPLILKASLPVELLSQLTNINRDYAFQNLLKDLFQIGTLFFVFSLMGIISSEVSKKKLVLPYSRGAKPGGIVLAKYIHYAVTVSFFILIAFLTNYFYLNSLFDGGILSIKIVLWSCFLYILYFAVILALLLYLSSLFKKSIIPGILVLAIVYGFSFFNQLSLIRNYLPNYLILRAAILGSFFDSSLIPTFSVSVSLIAIFIYLTIIRMKKIDVA
jgi:ABC-2 type transport system permease protein